MWGSRERKKGASLKDSLCRVTLSDRDETWALLVVALFASLFAGYEYGHIVPLLATLHFLTLGIVLGAMRLLCVMGVCVALATAVYCALLLTGEVLSADEPRNRRGKRRR